MKKGNIDKVKENRLRRVLKRRGLTLKKSRRRDPGALDYRGYWIVDSANPGRVLAGSEGGMSFADLEKWLDRNKSKKGTTKQSEDPIQRFIKLLKLVPNDLFLLPDGSPSYKTMLLINALSEELEKISLDDIRAKVKKAESTKRGKK